MLLRGRAQDRTENLVLIGLARAQVWQPAGQLEAHRVEEHPPRRLIRQQGIGLGEFLLMRAHERCVKYRAGHDRHIGRDHVEPRVQIVHLFQHLGALARERDHNDNILAELFDDFGQLFHPEAAEAVPAHEFIAREHACGSDAERLEPVEDFVRAVAHAVKHNRARLRLQPRPDRLLQCLKIHGFLPFSVLPIISKSGPVVKPAQDCPAGWKKLRAGTIF